MERQYCFMCGASTVALGQRAVPVCADCRARGLTLDPGQGQWMIERPGEPARGPLTHGAVLNWIARGRVGPDDRIGAVGGVRMQIADHPDFRSCFMPGTADEEEIARLRHVHQRAMRKAAVGRWSERLTAVALLGVASGAVYFGLSTRALVLSPEWFGRIEEGQDWIDDAIETQSGSVVIEDEVKASDLPHASWVEAQGVAGADPLLAYHRAERGLWEAETRDLDQVRRDFLTAMANNPLDPMPLAGLLHVNAECFETRPELGGETARAAARLDLLAAGSLAESIARAHVALSQGNRLQALKKTENCVERDPTCALLHGEASLSMEEIQGVRAQMGPVPRVLRALGRTAFMAKDWIGLDRVTQTMIERMPDDGLGYALRAEHQAAIGGWADAASLAEWAVQLDAGLIKTQHLEAAVILNINQDPRLALEKYRRLMQSHLLSGYDSRQVVLVQGTIAALQAGDIGQARAWSDAAVEAVPADPGALLGQAFVRLGDGDISGAENNIRAIDSTSLDGRDGASIHLWSGRLFLDMGKERLAYTELEAAQRLAPYWTPVIEEILWAQVKTQDVPGAIKTVHDLASLPKNQMGRNDPRDGLGLGIPPARDVRPLLVALLDQDLRYDGEREPVSAILSWVSGREDSMGYLREVHLDYPGHLAVRAALGQAALGQGRWAEALDHADEVIASKPRSALFQIVRGEALMGLDKQAEAQEALIRGTKLGGEWVYVLERAARMMLARGNLKEARRMLELAQESDPGDALLRRTLLDLDRREE